MASGSPRTSASPENRSNHRFRQIYRTTANDLHLAEGAPHAIFKGMHDIRDLLSGSLHIERIVFACDITWVRHEPFYQKEKRTHYYRGAVSGDRFLLLQIPSPETANQPVDLLKLAAPTFVARTSDADFYYNGPLLTPQPRSTPNSNLENAFRARLHPLRDCLQLGLMEIKPGSIRWDGDHFNADYPDEMKNHGVNYSISFGKPGENVPESVKEKYLADLLNPPPNRPMAVLSGKAEYRMSRDGKITWASDGNLEPLVIPQPASGSVEARIVAAYAARHEAKMAKGINGQLQRDAQRNVCGIHLNENPCRIELDYAPSADLPLPWPHRIRRFINSSQSEPEVPCTQMTIYAARVSDQPLEDAVFVPWTYLKEGSYVRGKALPNGHFTAADPKDQKLLMELHRSQKLPPI